VIRNVLEYIEAAAARFPNKTAFASEDNAITYGECLIKVNRMGYALSGIIGDVRKPVVVLMEKSVECLVSFFGVIASGNFYVCVDSNMAVERLLTIIDNLQPAAIIVNGETELATNVPIYQYDSLVTKPDDIAEDDIVMSSVLDGIRHKVTDTDPVYVLYTSGSTGVPKGSVIPHRSVIEYAEWISEEFGINEETIFGSQTPFYFSMSVLDIFTTIRNGATLEIIPKKYFSFPVKLLQFMAERQVNTVYWVPSALSIVSNWKALDYVPVPTLNKILFAGETMPTKILNDWIKHIPEAMYANLFGPTEITDIALFYKVNRTLRDDEPVPIGNVAFNMDAFAINEDGKLIGDGEIGELYFRGSFLGCGYYNAPDKTAEFFVQNPLNNHYPEPVYKTGDLVRFNEYGEYMFVGRADSQIKHMGYRIELGEVEAAVSACQDINLNVCMYDAASDNIVCVYQGKATEEQLINELDKFIPQYMKPTKIHKIVAMPYNANGKIDRRKLRDEYIGK